MATSVNDLKQRLRDFLSGAFPEQEFRVWFAFTLRDVHEANDPNLESLAHEIQRAFSDAASGVYTPAQLTEMLSCLAKPEVAYPNTLSFREAKQPDTQYMVQFFYVPSVTVTGNYPSLPNENIPAASGALVPNWEAVA